MPPKNKSLTAPSLRTFLQHGFKAVGISGDNQAYGNCIFCGKEKKFYVNIETKQWDCKSCQKAGGFQTWLKEVSEYCQHYFSHDTAHKLSDNRYIDSTTLKHLGVGYNPYTKAYILPVWDMGGEKLHDLRIYKNKKLLSTAGCKVALYNWQLLSNNYTTIHLCEGEWDCIAMQEALIKANKNEVALAVPGANTFKQEWCGLFKNISVNVLYDNDEGGRTGAVKVYNYLEPLCRKLQFIHWKKNEPPKKDIRDLYKILRSNPETFLKHIRSKLQDKPQDYDKVKIKANIHAKGFKFDGPGHTAQEVYDVYRKWLELKNTDVIDVLFGTVIANRLPGSPLWLLLVASSGGVKSELIMSLDDVINVYDTSSLTPYTLISGSTFTGGGDPSLIPRLDGKILTIKDFTTILQMNPIAREAIFSQLRDAFDGKASKEFGLGMVRRYKSKFGVIAGVTEFIEIFKGSQTMLGERFVNWNIPDPESDAAEKLIIRKALKNDLFKVTMQKALRECAAETLNYDYKIIPDVSDDITDKIISLGRWAAMLRGGIDRDRYTKEVQHFPFKEIATRISQELNKMIQGVGMFKRLKNVGMTEYNLLKHTALSTVSKKIKRIVTVMYRKQKGWLINDLANQVRLPYNTIERVVEDLRLLGSVEKTQGRLKAEYALSKKLLKMMEENEILK